MMVRMIYLFLVCRSNILLYDLIIFTNPLSLSLSLWAHSLTSSRFLCATQRDNGGPPPPCPSESEFTVTTPAYSESAPREGMDTGNVETTTTEATKTGTGAAVEAIVTALPSLSNQEKEEDVDEARDEDFITIDDIPLSPKEEEDDEERCQINDSTTTAEGDDHDDDASRQVNDVSSNLTDVNAKESEENLNDASSNLADVDARISEEKGDDDFANNFNNNIDDANNSSIDTVLLVMDEGVIRKVISGEVYEVPFDEEPMRAVAKIVLIPNPNKKATSDAKGATDRSTADAMDAVVETNETLTSTPQDDDDDNNNNMREGEEGGTEKSSLMDQQNDDDDDDDDVGTVPSDEVLVQHQVKTRGVRMEPAEDALSVDVLGGCSYYYYSDAFCRDMAKMFLLSDE
jgi:hypothetical protein